MLSSKKCSFISNLIGYLNFITWALRNWCFRTVVLGKTPESPLDSKEIKPVNLKGNQPWIFTGRKDADAEAPIVWSPGAKSQLTGKDWCWERLRAKGEDGGRWWDGEITSLTQWTWVWTNFRQWWTGKAGLLQSTGSQRVGHHLASEQLQEQYTYLTLLSWLSYFLILKILVLNICEFSNN